MTAHRQFATAFDVLADAETAETAVNAVIKTRQDLAGALHFPGEDGVR